MDEYLLNLSIMLLLFIKWHILCFISGGILIKSAHKRCC